MENRGIARRGRDAWFPRKKNPLKAQQGGYEGRREKTKSPLERGNEKREKKKKKKVTVGILALGKKPKFFRSEETKREKENAVTKKKSRPEKKKDVRSNRGDSGARESGQKIGKKRRRMGLT